MCQIDGAELLSRMNNGEMITLLDVREEIEFHTYNIGGKNIPVGKLSKNIGNLGYNKADEIIVICKVGLRSETARSILVENGYQQVRNLTGGLLGLQKLLLK